MRIPVLMVGIMDRGYRDLEHFYRPQDRSSLQPVLMCRVQSQAIEKTTGVKSDWIVRADGVKMATAYPDRLRRVRFSDSETKRP
jgi:hypothetical protein